jgi:hypothetical protein
MGFLDVLEPKPGITVMPSFARGLDPTMTALARKTLENKPNRDERKP